MFWRKKKEVDQDSPRAFRTIAMTNLGAFGSNPNVNMDLVNEYLKRLEFVGNNKEQNYSKEQVLLVVAKLITNNERVYDPRLENALYETLKELGKKFLSNPHSNFAKLTEEERFPIEMAYKMFEEKFAREKNPANNLTKFFETIQKREVAPPRRP